MFEFFSDANRFSAKKLENETAPFSKNLLLSL